MVAGAICSEVQSHVLLGEVHRLGRAIQRINALCSCVESIDREAPRVAEGIEDSASLSVVSYKSAVVTLVDEEARLLALKPVGSEAHAVLIDRRCLGMPDKEAIRSEFAHITSG